jgi:GNAT superfamily N-acetyltransferase
MQAMRVDSATIADIPRLAELLTILFSQEVEFEPDRALQERGLREIIDNPAAGQILVLREGEAIWGMVSLLFIVSTALGGRAALLEDMVVAPERRGRGAGALLLTAATDFARRAGCLRITLLTDRSNLAGQRFYARHGFTASTMLAMRLLIGAEHR